MRAMILRSPCSPLEAATLPTPSPGPGEILVEVQACGVCRTDLHVVDGELPDPKLPLVPGHEIVGIVAALGAGVTSFGVGVRVGVPWLGHTCGLCDAPRFTG
jgi:propanol-preferring alcohol dehydrogenase